TDLEAVTARVSVPVLRKDFIATPYQVFEARAAGADLALLIVAGLSRSTLHELHALILELGMTPLIETHSAEELDVATDLGASLIGVNARNLKTLELDRDLFARLADRIPDTAIRVAEPAVLAPDDVRRYREAGAHVVLIGEALVTGDPVATLASYLEAGSMVVRDQKESRWVCATSTRRSSASSGGGTCPNPSSPLSMNSPSRTRPPSSTRSSAPYSPRCCTRAPGARRRSPKWHGSPGTPVAPGCSSSA